MDMNTGGGGGHGRAAEESLGMDVSSAGNFGRRRPFRAVGHCDFARAPIGRQAAWYLGFLNLFFRISETLTLTPEFNTGVQFPATRGGKTCACWAASMNFSGSQRRRQGPVGWFQGRGFGSGIVIYRVQIPTKMRWDCPKTCIFAEKVDTWLVAEVC